MEPMTALIATLIGIVILCFLGIALTETRGRGLMGKTTTLLLIMVGSGTTWAWFELVKALVVGPS